MEMESSQWASEREEESGRPWLGSNVHSRPLARPTAPSQQQVGAAEQHLLAGKLAELSTRAQQNAAAAEH